MVNLVSALLLLAATAAPVKPAEPRIHTPTLVVRDKDDGPLPLTRLEVEATIVGFLARTSLTMTFYNPVDRPLEGELVFPLPEGATVSGYALDVEGQLVEGVVVEAKAARIAFEAEQRKRVDPGLVEWVRGDHFRTRVWPIPPRGTRTVRVEYVSDIATAPGSSTGRYTLPLQYDGRIREAKVRVEVVKSQAPPIVQAAPLADLRFRPFRDSFIAETTLREAELRGELEIGLPDVQRPTVTIEESAGAWYFTIDDFPEAVAAAAPRSIRRVDVLWDASLSRASVDTRRERDFLARWLAALGEVEVDLVVFRNVPEPRRRFVVRGGDARRLTEALADVAYDGGTSLGALPTGTPDVVLLFSDGLGTLGDRVPPPARVPVYVVTGGASGDSTVLRHIAEASGGAYLNLTRVTDDAATAALAGSPFSLVAVDASAGAVAECQPSGRRPVTGRVTVTGRLIAPEATVTLRYGHDGRATASRTFTLRRREAVRTGLVSRYWAQQKAAALSIDAERNHAALVALGRQHGIVTPGTSLLVLETLAQHLEHGIEPPPSRAAMRDAYLAQVADQRRQRVKAANDKLERVIEDWAERVEWWRTDFRPTPTPKPTRIPVPAAAAPTPTPPPPVSVPCATDAGDVSGAVLDQTGAAIAGALLSLTHETTQATVFGRSDTHGRYRVCGPGHGHHALTAEMAGFRTFTRRVHLQAQQRAVVDVVLSVGAMTETIEVAADTPQINVEAAHTAVNGRDFSQLTLAAGVAGTTAPTATIAVRPWDPDMPYLRALAESPAARAYAVYLAQREAFGGSPAFYLDCADFFHSKQERALAVRILTSVLELKLDEPRLLRVVAHRLEQIGERDLAIALFEKVLRLRPEEPQSPRDLALALSSRGDAHRAGRSSRDAAAADYLRALELLNTVVLGDWDRFDGIETIALMEANRIVAVLERDGLGGRDRIPLDPRLRARVDVDLRIVLTWDTDQTDMDLWVTEPSGERCNYSHSLTARGGAMSRDFTDGYGPEEYAVRRAQRGPYRIEANYYGSRAVSFTGPTTVQATVITNFGRANERREALTLRLEAAREVVEIGEAIFAATSR